MKSARIRNPVEVAAVMNIDTSMTDSQHQPVIDMPISEYNLKQNIHREIETKIVLTDDEPVFQKPRPLAPIKKKVVEK